MLSKSIYEALPYVCALFGVGALLANMNALLSFSGLLLLLIAGVLFFLRLNGRTSRMEKFKRMYEHERKKHSNEL
jgi:hypothetical protein